MTSCENLHLFGIRDFRAKPGWLDILRSCPHLRLKWKPTYPQKVLHAFPFQRVRRSYIHDAMMQLAYEHRRISGRLYDAIDLQSLTQADPVTNH